MQVARGLCWQGAAGWGGEEIPTLVPLVSKSFCREMPSTIFSTCKDLLIPSSAFETSDFYQCHFSELVLSR